ncbi:MAG: dockerin type I domain-containing protein [Gemmatimonadota bacterium]|nr:dockerin type I domain-containing protein [Gemmatimonadota bacterium]
MLPKRTLLLIAAIAVVALAAQAFAGPNANAVLSLDLISGGGDGNRTDDGMTSGTVSGRGTTIAVEVFATGVRTTLAGVNLKFDFDASLVSFVKAENSTFPLSLPEGAAGAALAATSPVTLSPSGFLARAEFTTVADVTGRGFSIGIESVTLAESTTSSDVLRTNSEVTFNSAPSPDLDGDDFVGFTDFLIFASAFGSRQGDGRYNAAADLNSDGSVDFTDFLIFAQSFGGPPPSPGGSGNPDLVVQSPSLSNSRVSPGATFTLGATVRNQGNGSSPSTTLHYYRSTDATVNASDTQVGTDAVSGLAAGNVSAESINLTAPSSTGTYYYGACVDAVSGESNTGNNCSPAVALTVAAAPPPTPGAAKLYWTDWGTDKIQRSNLDGSGIEDLVTGGGLDGPDGMALDMAGGKMYWTDAGTNKVQRANLDGSGVEDLVTGLGIPYGLALDVSGGKMYWTNRQANKIQRADLNGANVEDLITSGLTFPGGLALDLSGGKMYWTNPGREPDSAVQPGRIRRRRPRHQRREQSHRACSRYIGGQDVLDGPALGQDSAVQPGWFGCRRPGHQRSGSTERTGA